MPLWEGNLEIYVLLAPQERNARHPIFVPDRVAREIPIGLGKDSTPGRKIRPCDLAPNAAWGDPNRGIVSNPLVLAGVTPRHDIELVSFFSEPHGSAHHGARSSVGTQADVLLAVNFVRDRHTSIVRGERGATEASLLAQDILPLRTPLGLLSVLVRRIAPKSINVLQARHAEMDSRSGERASQALGEEDGVEPGSLATGVF